MVPVSGDDQARLSSAFGNTMNAMRQCTGNGSWGRRLSSPVLNVRVNFKGEVTDVGVDTRGFDEIDSCLSSVQRPLPGGAFAGPATIRCAEKCERTQMKARAGAKKKK
jgi:hypothetical protein